jgi:dCMP deaminase
MLRLARSGGQGLKGGTMYVTASPCVLCSKKAYQIGIKEIVYLDPYTDIAPDLILGCGFGQSKLRPFMGAIGETFYKLYKPFLPYKDELAIWDRGVKKEKK